MKKIGLLFVTVIMLMLFAISVSAEVEGDFEYSVNNNEATIVRYIGDGGELIIPDTLGGYKVVAIGHSAFYNCSNLTGNLIIPDSVISIGDFAFSGCTGLTGDLIIPKGITSIGHATFQFCSSMAGNLVIPEGVTSIEDCAFGNCHSLTGDLVIPESVESIGFYAFGNCCNLTGDLIIPKGVTSIGDCAFSLCASLNRIVVNSDNKNYSSDENGVLFNKNKSILMQYPLGNKAISYSVPNGVTKIEDGAFANSVDYRGFDNLCEIYIPLSVVQFGLNISGLGGFNHIGYEGNQAQWEAILKEEYNEHMSNVHYNFIEEKDFKVQTTTVSCTTDGLTKRTCLCGYNYTLEFVAAFGHNIGEFIAVKESSCSEKGEKRAYCSRCDYYEIKKTPLKKHTNTNDDEYCDVCELYLPSLDCLCICHAKTIGAFVYKLFTILDKFFGTRLLEKVFDISEYCACGLKH